MVRARILVVDDDAPVLAMLRRRLSKLGYETEAAADGKQAILAVDNGDFDVVLTDMQMPGMSGLEVIEHIKAVAPSTEIIIATAHANLENAIASFKGGACEYLEKPFETTRLFLAVEHAIERRRLRFQESLQAASETIFSVKDAEALPASIVEIAIRVMHGDDASLMLATPDGELVVAHSHRLEPAIASSVRVRIGEGVAGRVALDRTPVLLSSSPAEAGRVDGAAELGRVRSSIVYPLVVGQRLLGVLAINRITDPKPFHLVDLERAGILASQVALAVDNARLVRDLRDKLAQLSSSQTRLVESERLAAVGLLAAGIVHEINNPLAYVLGNIEYVVSELEGRGDATLSEAILALKDSVQGARRMCSIVKDMRQLARPATGEGSTFDVNETIQSAMRIAKAEVKGRVELIGELGHGLEVSGHPGQLTQVFLNLIVNASQAIAEAGDKGKTHRIHVRSFGDGTRIVVEVSDTGPGIPSEHLGRIFEPLFTTKPPGKGTGLGLSISREIVRRHGGDLVLGSQPAEGATFIATLPMHPEQADGEPAPGPVERRRCRILCVDDDPQVLDAFRRSAGREHDVVVAATSAAAWSSLEQSQSFDLIICDLLLEGTTGMELYRRVVVAYPELDRRFVFITGGMEHEEVRSFVQSVGHEVLEKPLDMNALMRLAQQRISQGGR